MPSAYFGKENACIDISGRTVISDVDCQDSMGSFTLPTNSPLVLGMTLCRSNSVCGTAVGKYHDSSFVRLALPLRFRDSACHNNLQTLQWSVISCNTQHYILISTSWRRIIRENFICPIGSADLYLRLLFLFLALPFIHKYVRLS